MSDDKIAEIRARHVLYPPSRNARYSFIMAYQDIAALLAEVDRLRAEVERLRAAARNALNELNCIEEDGGHRCIRCDSEIDEGHHVRIALRNALEGKP